MKRVVFTLLSALVVISVRAQIPLFAFNNGSSGEDYGYKVAKDGQGNIFTTGTFTGTVDFDPGPAIFNLTSSGSSDIYLTKYSPQGNLIWAIRMGGFFRDGGFALTTDNSGNVYLTGYFRQTADFDPSAAVFNLVSNGDAGSDPGYGGEIFLAKYSSAGNLLWAFGIGGSTMYDNGQAISLDPAGNIVLAGYFVGVNVDFDPNASSSFGLGDGTEQQFLAKYTSAGGFIWAGEIGGPNDANETVRDVDIDASGNIYITGYFTFSADFDPGPGSVVLTATSEHQGYVAKYTSNGTFQWVYQFGGSGNNQGLGISVANGFIYFTGVVTGNTITFTGASGSTVRTGLGAGDAFLAKMDINGNLVFADIVGGPGEDLGFDIDAISSSNSFYLTGYFSSQADFDQGPALATLNSAGGTDIFVASYTLTGNYVSSFRIGSATNDACVELTTDGNAIIISGYFTGTLVDFDPTPSAKLVSSNGSFDAFLAKYVPLQPVVLCQGSLGDPVVNITFGAGNNPGQPLGTLVPGASTTHTYVAVNGNPATPTPVDGQYTITNNVPSNAAWFSGQPDHTPNDVNGYMAFYNSQETAGQEFYKQTVNNLCGGTTYEFAAWVANCLNPVFLDGVDPNISFIIETTGGTILGSYSTGPISENTIFQWQQFGFFFTLPAGETSVVLKMINNSVGGAAQPGNDLAIDDITFRPCGPLLTASLSNSQFLDSITICQGSTQNLYGTLASGFTSPNYRWQTSIDGITWLDAINSNTLQYGVTPAASMGTYYMYRAVAADGNNINSFNCRIVSNTLYIRVNEIPQGILTGDTICAGSAARFRFTATQGLGPFSISFRDPGGAVYTQNGITSGQPFFAPLNVFATTPFTLVSIRDGSGCERLTGFNSNAIVVTVRNDLLKAPRDTITCESSPVVLNGNNGPAYQYQWTPATFLNDPLSPTPVCTPLATQRYSVRITDPLCGTDSVFSIQVNVNPKPPLVAQKANDIDCTTPTAQLNAAGAQSYVWTPATGLTNPNSASPVASITTTTTYTVTGTNSLGCSATAQVTVNVTRTGKPVFELPNAFTPNGDGRNDCFGIRRWVNVTVKEFSIFNRWGQLVFTSKNSGACWDGTLNGKLQPSGGYTYVIRATGFCGDVEKKGIVMLLR